MELGKWQFFQEMEGSVGLHCFFPFLIGVLLLLCRLILCEKTEIPIAPKFFARLTSPVAVLSATDTCQSVRSSKPNLSLLGRR